MPDPDASGTILHGELAVILPDQHQIPANMKINTNQKPPQPARPGNHIVHNPNELEPWRTAPGDNYLRESMQHGVAEPRVRDVQNETVRLDERVEMLVHSEQVRVLFVQGVDGVVLGESVARADEGVGPACAAEWAGGCLAAPFVDAGAVEVGAAGCALVAFERSAAWLEGALEPGGVAAEEVLVHCECLPLWADLEHSDVASKTGLG
ncbi:hypothetical protein OPT61_g2175 [Boeremia exigua]|uniref:Uncharacterized protein n=1 Tax=Boeremia exigua TaxID=749465 RepID=A0ACC2IMI9_9PLEO|nr:hypothetical protein OPT61_g2175 [Boeremia exigua]